MWRPIRCSVAAGIIITVVTGALDLTGYATALAAAWPNISPAFPLVGVFLASMSIIWLCYEAGVTFFERGAKTKRQEEHDLENERRRLAGLTPGALEMMRYIAQYDREDYLDYASPMELERSNLFKEELTKLGLAPPSPTRQGDWCRYLESMIPLVTVRGIEGALTREEKSHE